MRPANTVGGDYFDVIDLGEGRVAVAVADVAGKGMPAALLMALLQGSLRTLITAGFRGADLIGKLNAHLHANIPANRLVTLFYCEVDAASGRIRYVNAGHNAPFLLRRGAACRGLPATDVALGIVPGAVFNEAEAALDPGDRLFVYTDGVSEAFDARDCEYGEGRLQVDPRRPPPPGRPRAAAEGPGRRARPLRRRPSPRRHDAAGRSRANCPPPHEVAPPCTRASGQ